MSTTAAGLGSEADDLALLHDLPRRVALLEASVRRAVVGQDDAVRLLALAMLCQGHTLIEGVPGLAKTMLVRTLAGSLRLDLSRIQFTPDMMPADVTGAELLHSDPATGDRSMRFVPGPIFAHVVLADEINRTPPKTQAALLEAMAERQVSVGGVTRAIEPPFIVVATQNPIEQEGTYPLPEAQLDRFMLGVRMVYPSAAEERRVVALGDEPDLAARRADPVFEPDELVRLRRAIGSMPAGEHVVAHAVALARATRPEDPSAPELVGRFVAWGAGPRAGQALLLGAKAAAAIAGEPAPHVGHLRSLAPAVLGHRVVLGYDAALERVGQPDVVAAVLDAVDESSGA